VTSRSWHERSGRGIKVLLTSGYAEDLVIDDQPGLAQLKILRKPYRQGDLVATLREVFADWERALRALADCARAGVGSARVIFIALSSVFNESCACGQTFELPFSEAGERVHCNSRFLAGWFDREALRRIQFEEAVRA